MFSLNQNEKRRSRLKTVTLSLSALLVFQSLSYADGDDKETPHGGVEEQREQVASKLSKILKNASGFNLDFSSSDLLAASADQEEAKLAKVEKGINQSFMGPAIQNPSVNPGKFNKKRFTHKGFPLDPEGSRFAEPPF